MLANTLIISSMKFVFVLPIPIFVALMLNEVRGGALRKSIQSAIYLPHFLSWVVIAGIFIALLSPSDGAVNQIIGWARLQAGELHDRHRRHPLGAGVLRDLALGRLGHRCSISRRSSPSIRRSTTAAELDGANRWQKIRDITLPGIAPTIATLFILNAGLFLSADLNQVINLQNDVNLRTIDIIDTYVYRIGLQTGEYSLATAAGLFKAVFGMILIVAAHFVSKRLTGKGCGDGRHRQQPPAPHRSSARRRARKTPIERPEYAIIISTLLLLVVITVQPILNLIAISFSDPSQVAGDERARGHPAGLLARCVDAPAAAPATCSAASSTRSSSPAPRTIIGVLGTALMAWGLSRPGLPGRRLIFVLVLVTIVFEPGIIPDYFLMKRMGLLDTYWAVILYKVGQRLVPDHPRALLRGDPVRSCSRQPSSTAPIPSRSSGPMVLPLARPALATIALFYLVFHWNEFFHAMIYLNDHDQVAAAGGAAAVRGRGRQARDRRAPTTPPTTSAWRRSTSRR